LTGESGIAAISVFSLWLIVRSAALLHILVRKTLKIQSKVLTCVLGIDSLHACSWSLTRKDCATCFIRPRSSLEFERKREWERGRSSKDRTCDIDMDWQDSFFEALRTEADSFTAKKPLISTNRSQQEEEIAALRQENCSLAIRIKALEQENRLLKTQHSPDHSNLDTSLSSSGPEEYQVLSLALESPEPAPLSGQVQRHKDFIRHLKRALEELLAERETERKEHRRTKAELERLMRTCQGLGGL